MEYENADWLDDTNNLDETGKKDFQLIQQITPYIFIEFLADKGVKTTCQSCGHPELFVPHITEHFGKGDVDDEDYNDIDDITYVTPVAKGNGPFRIHNIKYEVNCSNCGFICHYQAYQVFQWAKSKGLIKDE